MLDGKKTMEIKPILVSKKTHIGDKLQIRNKESKVKKLVP
jgi:hypothetical protein